MPELPEVETIRRQLLPLYRGETIRKAILKTPRLLKNASAKDFRRSLPGKTIEDFRRRGKFLIIHCGEVYPVFHLGMSGIFLKDKAESRYPQHIHLEMIFDSGKQLYFQDMRKFGKIWLYKKPPEFPGLGVEPLGEELSGERLAEMLKGKQMNIKQFLMGQEIIAGIGNIYASEILFAAKISPLRKTNSLQPPEIAVLHREIGAILSAAVERFGTTYSAYRTVEGVSGQNQNFLKVYQRAEEACYTCGKKIRKIVLGSRSTFYCENCQR